ncbi:MAG: hypothetical protein Q7S22_05745 [Candidatus Micrarchaeota archaeon]|nr:hypothetical protein [Candidatus Micrarchaeota archaeon]
MEDFYAVAETAKKIEKNALPHVDFNQKVEVIKDIDFSPAEFAELTYPDLINIYERTGKIISASKMQIFAGAITDIPRVAPTELETRVRGITSDSLEHAEEMSKEIEFKSEPPIVTVSEPQKLVEEKKTTSVSSFDEISLLDFEKHIEHGEGPKEIISPKEERKITAEDLLPSLPKTNSELEFDLKPEVKRPQKKEEIERIPRDFEEKKKMPEVEIPKAESVQPLLPTVLQQAADQAATEKFAEVEEHFSREWGGAVDELKVKKKMLELTKELFKEKSVNRREKIKLEISVLKNMLTGLKTGIIKKKSVKEDDNYYAKLFSTVVDTQKSERSSNKDSVVHSYGQQIDSIRQKFTNVLLSLPEDDGASRKVAFEKFVFELTSISEQLPDAIAKNMEFVVQKHRSELMKLLSSEDIDKKSAKDIQEYLNELESTYSKEFQNVQSILEKNIDTLIHTLARHALSKDIEPNEKEEKIEDIVSEINQTDEGSLLYYLHSKDPDAYKKYERNHISKHESLQLAKIMIAKDKGLSDVSITKYFGDFRG